MSQKYYVCHRRGTAEQWASANIKPLAGEIVVEIDNVNNLHKLKIGDGEHSYADLAYLMAGDDIVSQVLPRTVTVTLEVEKWAEVTSQTNPNIGHYSQEVVVDGITAHSRVDLQPDADMIAEFRQLNLVFTTENKGGVITVYSVGDMPLKTYTMQATIIETQVLIDSDKIMGIPIGAPKKIIERSDLSDEINELLDRPGGGGGIVTETDPTVPNHVKEITTDDISNWNAKSDFSGSYDDLANKPTIPVVPTNLSAFENDSGYLTSYTETDPTVPSWAKAETKPAYSYNEIANKPTFATVAISGNYADLAGVPSVATSTTDGLMSATDKENLDVLVDSFSNDDSNTTIDTVKEVLKAFENAPEGTNIANALASKVDANEAIQGATKTKITYDSKGLVTSGSDLAASDIPNMDANKITSGTFADDRIASAATWNAKQEAISDLATIRSGAAAGATAIQADDLAAVATSGSYVDLLDLPTINGVELTGAKTSSDLNLGMVTSNAGFQAGTSSSATNGGAIGCQAKETYGGGAVGYQAAATAGGAVGREASVNNGGAVGRKASAKFGGAVGWEASVEDGGAVGWKASATNGGAIGNGASATSGGAIGNGANATNGGAIGYQSSAEGGGAIGYQSSAGTGGAVGYQSSAGTGGAVGREASAGNGFAGGQSANARYASDGQIEITGAVAIGVNALAQAHNAIQFGTGTNTNMNTLQFRDYQLVDANGKIPSERLPEVDLSDYYTQSETDELLCNYYTQSETDELLCNYYTQSETDELLRKVTPKYCEEITYTELKALRDSNELIPGMFYRITDYVCTTTQEDTTAVQGTDFDIIVQALSKNILSEIASVCAHSSDPVLMSSVLTNKVIKSHVVPYYYEYVDYSDQAADGVDPNYRQGKDVFIAYDYLANNEGTTVPVIYKTDAVGLDPTRPDFNSEFDGPDYEDQFYYEGTADVDGVTYDKWRLINEGGDEFTWDGPAKCYIYTNQIVNNGTIELESFLYEEETDEYRLDCSAVALSYYEFVDCNYGYGLAQDSEKKFAAYEYLPNEKGNIVPVLHDWCEDAIGYNENYYYEGRATIDGQIYDKWRKIELDATDEDDFGWDTPGKAYYYTNVIVEGGVSAPSDINFPAWEIKYCLDNDKTRFAWAEISNVSAFMVTCDETYIYLRYPQGDNTNGIAWAYVNNTGNLQFTDVTDWTNIDPDDIIYTQKEIVALGETYEMSGEEVPIVDLRCAGKGVIYYMKDEFNNECSYDFKNIQFEREGTYYYTFSWVDENSAVKDLSIVGNTTIFNDEGQISGCYENKMGIVSLYNFGGWADNPSNLSIVLNNNVFISTYDYEEGLFYGCHSNTFGNDCYSNTFGNSCYSNTFGNSCRSNTFGNSCRSNTFGNHCDSNTFGNYCDSNTFGNNCRSNTLGSDCAFNTFGNYCCSNTFGNLCGNNIIDSGVTVAQPQPITGSQYMRGVHIHYGVTGQFTVVRGAEYTQDIRKSGSQEILLD